MTVLVAYRLANWDTPFWAGPNRRDSRFGREGDIVQYWSLHPLTPWAEQLRFHGVRNATDAQELILRPWAAEFSALDGVLEVSFETAAEKGIDPAALVADDWESCQNWAQTLDAPGIIAPSAALPGTKNLVLFGERVRSPYGLTAIDPSVDVPCDPVAEVAMVVMDLLQHVRWRGTPHAAYDAWAAGLPVLAPPLVSVDRS